MDWRLKRLTGWTLALLLCGVGMGTLPLAAESVPAPPPTAGDSDRQLTVNLEIFLEAVRRVEDDCRSGRIKNLPDQQLVQSHQMLSQILAACTELRREYAAGRDRILRGATALLFIHAPRASRFGVEDANLACQNASLMAEALGVSQIYMGFVLTAVRQDRRKRLNRMLGLQGRLIGAVLAFGMPEFLYPNYIDRDPAPRN